MDWLEDLKVGDKVIVSHRYYDSATVNENKRPNRQEE